MRKTPNILCAVRLDQKSICPLALDSLVALERRYNMSFWFSFMSDATPSNLISTETFYKTFLRLADVKCSNLISTEDLIANDCFSLGKSLLQISVAAKELFCTEFDCVLYLEAMQIARNSSLDALLDKVLSSRADCACFGFAVNHDLVLLNKSDTNIGFLSSNVFSSDSKRESMHFILDYSMGACFGSKALKNGLESCSFAVIENEVRPGD